MDNNPPSNPSDPLINRNEDGSAMSASGDHISIATADSNKPRVVQVGGNQVSWNDLLTALKKQPSTLDHGENRKLNLGDVIASKPIEQEAETHILRAVEKVANNNQDRKTDAETDSLLRDIASQENKQYAEDEDEDEARDTVPELRDTKEHNTLHSADTQPSKSSVSARLQGKARLKSLVKKHMTSSNVSQTLQGLSSALAQMDEDNANGLKEDSAGSSSDRSAAHNLARKASKRHLDIESQGAADITETHRDGSSGSMDEGSESTVEGTGGKRGHHHKGFFQDHVVDGIGENWKVFNQFLSPRKAKARSYARKVVMYIMIPSLLIAAFLFYVVENPSLCEEKDDTAEVDIDLEPRIEPVFDVNGTVVGNITVIPEEPEREFFVCPGLGASASWWFLFLGVRQVLTFSMAIITQALIVDYLALSTRYCLAWFGPVVTLFLVNAKGWPFIAVFWAVYDLILLAGDQPYNHWWLHWQDWIGLFNENNPSGNVVNNEWNFLVLRIAIFIGAMAAVKRLFVSLFLGRQTFARYGEQLSNVMKNMVLLGEVATLAKDIEKYSGEYANNVSSLPSTNQDSNSMTMKDLWEAQAAGLDGSDQAVPSLNAAEAAKAFMAHRDSSPAPQDDANIISRGTSGLPEEEFSHSQQLQLSELLDAWEEPQTAEEKEEKKISIGAVLNFRQALAFMKVRYPFLPAFGLADTREHCIESAQQVYERLLLRTPNQGILPFDTLALLAKDDRDKLDQEKAKLLIKTFRPDRDGKLSKLDFVKSVDSVYKSIRLLSANISNSSAIDEAVERIFNFVFYAGIGAITIAWLGVDPLQLFLSLSSVLLAFSFLFGSASAQYFKGILFILAQAPYGVGDRIHFSNPQTETSIDGSSGWIVEKVSLYTTSLYWGATNERATVANGALSNMRVINAARSPNAQIFVNMKFAIDTPYEKIDIFKAAVEQFLKDRPREWLAFVGFRPTDVAVDKGYINYVTIAQHRSAWQDIGSVLVSKAELVTYELEVAKKLDMRYHSPHLPVDLKIEGGGEITPQNIMDLGGDNNDSTHSSIDPRSYVSRMGGRNRAFVSQDGGDE